jgi:molybdopterin converting factor subunit 1
VPDSVTPLAPPTIDVRVRLFASYREAAGASHLQRTLPAGATVGNLEELLAKEIAPLAAAHGLVAVNQEYVEASHVLHQGDEVAFIPPVSGGA